MNGYIFSALLILSISIALPVQQPRPAGAQQSQQNTDSKAAPASKASANDEKRAAEIETFITYAQSVPPEFSADLLIQLVESGEIKDTKRRQDLLVEAFYTAAKAKEQVKLVALPGSAVDSRAGYRATAARAGLDTLSLQSRAIRALVPLNKKKARQLFSEIKFKLEPVSCENTLGYDVEAFFTTIQTITQSGFSAEENRRGELASFVENYISKINSPNQIQPAVKLLLSLQTTDLELEILGRAFSNALQQIPIDDRSFAAPWNSTVGSMDELIALFNRRGLSTDKLVEAYRTYLVNQLSGPRCADTASKQQQELESDLVSHFNEKLRSISYTKIPAIGEDEIKPVKREGSARNDAYWTSAKSKSILVRVKKLRFSGPGKEFTEAEKQSAEWQSQLSELLKELASWSAEDEKSEEDYFHQKSVIYYALFKSIPADAQYDGMRDEALRDFAAMLSSSPLQKEKPAEWFLHAKVLIDRVNKAQPGERAKLLNLINSSRSNVLQLYIEQQQISRKEAQKAQK